MTIFNPCVMKIPWRRKWQPTPGFLPGASHGQRSLADYRLWCCKESGMTEQLTHTHTHTHMHTHTHTYTHTTIFRNQYPELLLFNGDTSNPGESWK